MSTNIITALVTAYVATGRPCANGKMPTSGTCALPRQFPLGSKVIVGGHTFHGDDRTALRYNGRIDLFVDSKKHALEWGIHRMTVTIITP